MEGLLFPKPGKRKKKIRHPESIMHRKDGTCYLCMMLMGDARQHSTLHRHHVFGGPNRIHSEVCGLTVWLCVEHHETGTYAVHKNADVMRMLHQAGQQAFETSHTRTEFMEIFGRNYLDNV